MPNEIVFIKRREKDKIIKNAIFAFSGGQKHILLKGEGQEITTAVEIAEILKNRLYPGIEIGNISLGSRPFYQKQQRGNYNKNKRENTDRNKRENTDRNKPDIISNIEIELKTTSFT